MYFFQGSDSRAPGFCHAGLPQGRFPQRLAQQRQCLSSRGSQWLSSCPVPRHPFWKFPSRMLLLRNHLPSVSPGDCEVSTFCVMEPSSAPSDAKGGAVPVSLIRGDDLPVVHGAGSCPLWALYPNPAGRKHFPYVHYQPEV